MEWQLVAVAACFAGALGYLSRQTWRTWSGRKSGCGSCACSAKPKAAAPSLISTTELTARLRR